MKIKRPILKWHSQKPADSNEEFNRLKQFYERESKRSREDSPELRNWRWIKAVEEYIQAGWPISLSTINEVWKNLTKGHDDQDSNSNYEKVSRAKARRVVEVLFDFSTNAIVYDNAMGSDFVGKMHTEQENRKPTGTNLQQDVFLAELPTRDVDPPPNPAPGQLDKFAMAIADLDGYDGIYFLSGVRGSGKTSILNRIVWYCEQWFDRTQKPLLVRFDLGTTFNREVFIRDLLAEICLSTKRTLRLRPFSLPFGLSWSTRAIGHLGRFCKINLPWTTIAAILIVLLIVTYTPSTSTPSTSSSNSNSNAAASTPLYSIIFDNTSNTNDKTLLWYLGKTEFRLLLLGLFGAIALGIVYNFRLLIFSVSQNRQPPKYLSIEIRNAFALILVTFVLIECFSAGYISNNFKQFEQVFYFSHLVSYLLCLFLLGIGVLVLPRWWESYCYVERILARVRSEPNQRVFDAPLFASMGSLSWFLARLLPTSESSEQLDKISEPFIQELMKQTLSECTRTFPRVVILIDDVDALPNQEFHRVMRLVRPISKVPGVRCVLSTPLFFHYVLGEENFSDIHSTVQASIVVGNPLLFPDWPEDPEKITDDRKILESFLIDLVVSRLRMDLREDSERESDDFRTKILNCPAFNFILEPWIREDDNFIHELFQRFGTSRREMIRVVRESLAPKIRDMSQKQERSRVMKNYGNALDRLKMDYRDQENALDCHIDNEETRINQTVLQELDKYSEITPQVENLIRYLDGERTRTEILQGLELKDRTNLAKRYLQPALDAGLIEMTIPDVPSSSKQKYRLTNKGRELQERLKQTR